VHGLGLAVAGDGDLRERGGGGEGGQFREPVPAQPGPAALAGALRGEAVQGGVFAQPGGPGDLLPELVQLLAGVGGIGGDVDAAAGQRVSEPLGHAAGQPQPRG
jgi:hypothetical protein